MARRLRLPSRQGLAGRLGTGSRVLLNSGRLLLRRQSRWLRLRRSQRVRQGLRLWLDRRRGRRLRDGRRRNRLIVGGRRLRHRGRFRLPSGGHLLL
ncbi:hypothetical protein [Amycolatopsis sp. RTGN1]|uniref:hypothetical protein n=1 Tax=Amycolatopsis ponsaeliensis TaxID=2992142 RepID=UPI00254A76AD|nr:hypothetical protein [Amycolatopsis sp. RTGN1]